MNTRDAMSLGSVQGSRTNLSPERWKEGFVEDLGWRAKSGRTSAGRKWKGDIRQGVIA